ncbi:MAG TPA: hypothetical protein VGJ21_03985 [Terracidiphilus sp.]|jgi:hypothetical protein
MRHFAIYLLFLMGLAAPAWANQAEKSEVSDILILRTGEELNAPHVFTYHVVEWEHVRGRWILPDMGYVDNGYGRDQTWFVAGGAKALVTQHLDWTQELFVTQEAGPDSHNKRSMRLWPIVNVRLPNRLSSQMVPYPTVPLDAAQRWSIDIDRAKLEWTANTRWVAGVGYSGGLNKNRDWASRPFLTTTRRTPAGSFEFWLERMPGGAQLQVRYVLVKNE